MNWYRWIAVIALLAHPVAQASVAAKPQAIFVGSSTIAGWRTLPEDFPEFATVNLGRGGTTYADLERDYRHWLAPALTHAPPTPLIFLYSGDNDLAHGKAPRAVLRDLESVIRAIHGERRDATVTVLTVKVSPARFALRPEIIAFNRLVREMAQRERNFQVIDLQDALSGADQRPMGRNFASDGLHLSREGYAIWRNTLRNYLFCPLNASPAVTDTSACPCASASC